MQNMIAQLAMNNPEAAQYFQQMLAGGQNRPIEAELRSGGPNFSGGGMGGMPPSASVDWAKLGEQIGGAIAPPPGGPTNNQADAAAMYPGGALMGPGGQPAMPPGLMGAVANGGAPGQISQRPLGPPPNPAMQPQPQPRPQPQPVPYGGHPWAR
jgi:hypothetical protein